MILGIGTANGLTLLAATPPGEPWKLVSQGMLGKRITCLAPTAQGVLLAGTAPGSLFKTRDFENWEAVYEGIKHPAIYSIALDPTAPDVIYAGTAPAGLFRSHDAGQHFQHINTLNRVASSDKWTYFEAPYQPRLHRLQLHPGKSSLLLAGIRSGGLYVSGDAGETWHDRSQGISRDLVDFQIHSAEPSRIYAATSAGFYRSDDLGASWQQHSAGLTHITVGPLAIAPEEANVIFLAVHRTKQGGAYLFRSPNGGLNWTACPGGLPFRENQRINAMVAARGNVFVGTNQGELFVTTNFGESWQMVKAQLPEIHCLTVVYQS